MADPGSSLAAALARDVQFINDDFYDEPGLGEALDEIIAAARERLRLSKIPCEPCGGLGWFWTDAEHTEEGKNPCPSCGGSGEVWADELVEVVAKTEYDHDARHTHWETVHESIKKAFRGRAIAVLDALDLYAKEHQHVRPSDFNERIRLIAGSVGST